MNDALTCPLFALERSQQALASLAMGPARWALAAAAVLAAAAAVQSAAPAPTLELPARGRAGAARDRAQGRCEGRMVPALLRMRGGSSFAALEDEAGKGGEVCAPPPGVSAAGAHRCCNCWPPRSGCDSGRRVVQASEAGRKEGAKAGKAGGKEGKKKPAQDPTTHDTAPAVPVPDHAVFNPGAADAAPSEVAVLALCARVAQQA